MDAAHFDRLDEAKKDFYKCEERGDIVDMRQPDDVLFHKDDVHKPDIG